MWEMKFDNVTAHQLFHNNLSIKINVIGKKFKVYEGGNLLH